MDIQAFVDRYNDLTGLFLRKIGEGKQDQNIVLSPFSVLSLLSILADAAGGDTRREVQDFLYGSLPHQGFREQLKDVREELFRRMSSSDHVFVNTYDMPLWESPTPDFSEHMNTVNAVIVDKAYRDNILPGFREQLKDIYDGKLLFSPELREDLNIRMSETTREMIPLLQETAETKSILAMINTVFFHARWLKPYKNGQIRKGIFHNADHTDSRVEMLYGGGEKYVENDAVTGFVKSFQQCDYSFMALLPREKGPEALYAATHTVNFSELMSQQQSVILHSMMPEIEVSFCAELKEMMKSLGVRKAFSPDEADFSSMSTAPLAAKQLIHQAKIEVDRNGARAAAVTALIFLTGCLSPEIEKHVMIDRPFIFAIMNNELKIPVFVGVVNHIDAVE